tara:strand:- start:163 stop:1002 length:840 start_codon:yes stop_codon:yes gene_type:complete
MKQYVIRIPSNGDQPSRWAYITAATRQEALDFAQAQYGTSTVVQGTTDPADSQFIGQSGLNFITSNPDRLVDTVDLSAPSTPPRDDGPLGPRVPSDDRSFLEAFQPGAAFRSALQGTSRDVTTSPFGRTISALQPFFQAGFLGDVAARGAEGVGRGVEGSELANQLRGPFEQFVGQTRLGGLGRLGGQAFDILSGGGGTPGEIPAGVSALRRSFTNPQTQGERERAANLGLLGAAQRFSPFAAFNLLPSGSEIARQAETAQFRDPGQDFLSFLRPSVGF